MSTRWYTVEYPDGGIDIACVNCWSDAQAEAIQAGELVHSFTPIGDTWCTWCGDSS